MSYVIFDLDQTLANITSVYFFITSLQIHKFLSEQKIEISMEDQIDLDILIPQLNKAYKLFVERVALEESSINPLGIIRPGILSIMKEINELKNKGSIKSVIIYSNNGCYYCLEFIRDIIQEYVKSSRLFNELIHWNHVIRNKEKSLYSGFISKTWDTMKDIISMNHNEGNIKTSEVYFFDDLEHVDLQNHLERHYYKVPAYQFNASFERLANIYRNVVYDSSINTYKLMRLLLYVFPNNNVFLFDFHKLPLENIINQFKVSTEKTVGPNDKPLAGSFDYGIIQMKDAIKEIKKKNIKLKWLGVKKIIIKKYSTKKKRHMTLRK
jgi:hypothetical protein